MFSKKFLDKLKEDKAKWSKTAENVPSALQITHLSHSVMVRL